MTARAGTVFYAPQARLVDVSSGRVIGTNVQTATFLGLRVTRTAVGPDLISATVTLPSSGVAQLEVVLNNQRFDGDGRPIFPPWKYNDFSALSERDSGTQDTAGTYALTFGQRVRLDIRYGSGPWTKLILARVTNLEFTFPTSGAQLRVIGEDMLSVLKVRPQNDHPYAAGLQEEDVLDDVLRRSQIGIDHRRTERAYQRPRGRGLPAIRHQKTTTFYQFVSEISDRLDAELFVDFVERQVESVAVPGAATASESRDDEAQPIDVRREVVVRMEPRRSAIPPGERDADWAARESAGEPGDRYIELAWGRNLVSFSPKFKVWEMPTSANASGSHPDRRGRARGQLTSDEIRTAIRAELHDSPAYPSAAARPIDAITARDDFFGAASDAADNTESSHASNLDPDRTELKALAAVLKKVREFMVVTGATIGIPKLRPGIHVHVVGMRPPFDGFYYVKQAIHKLDAAGYSTSFTLERPGMLPPGQYLTESNDEAHQRQQREAARADADAAGAGGGG